MAADATRLAEEHPDAFAQLLGDGDSRDIDDYGTLKEGRMELVFKIQFWRPRNRLRDASREVPLGGSTIRVLNQRGSLVPQGSPSRDILQLFHFSRAMLDAKTT